MNRDVYTDRCYWQHSRTHLITYDKPGLQHYLPPNFMIPDPPVELPPNISLVSSSSEEESGSGGDWEKQKAESRQRKHANSPKKKSMNNGSSRFSSRKEDKIGRHRSGQGLAENVQSLISDDSDGNSTIGTLENWSEALVIKQGEAGFDASQEVNPFQGQQQQFQLSYASEGLSEVLQKALGKAREYIQTSTVYAQLKSKSLVEATTDLSDVIVGLRAKTEVEYEQAFRNIRKKRSQLNPVRHHTYIHQATRKPRSLEQMKSDQHQEKLREKAAEMKLDGATNEEILALDSRTGAEVFKPTKEQLLEMAGGSLDMITTGKKGVELRSILAHRAMHIQKRLHEQAVEKNLMRPKTFFQREIMPLFSSTYHSDDSDSNSENGDDEERKKKQRQRRDAAKKKKQEQQQLKDNIMDKARRKRNAIKLQPLEG